MRKGEEPGEDKERKKNITNKKGGGKHMQRRWEKQKEKKREKEGRSTSLGCWMCKHVISSSYSTLTASGEKLIRADLFWSYLHTHTHTLKGTLFGFPQYFQSYSGPATVLAGPRTTGEATPPLTGGLKKDQLTMRLCFVTRHIATLTVQPLWK